MRSWTSRASNCPSTATRPAYTVRTCASSGATILNPWTEDRVNAKNPARGPLLLIAGEKDHTVPLAVVTAEYKLQQHNPEVTEFREIPGRGHSLIIDHGWREVAEIVLAFIAQQLQKA